MLSSTGCIFLVCVCHYFQNGRLKTFENIPIGFAYGFLKFAQYFEVCTLHSEESGVQKWLWPSASEGRTLKRPPSASYGLQYRRTAGRMQ